jgi:hypothetical protein
VGQPGQERIRDERRDLAERQARVAVGEILAESQRLHDKAQRSGRAERREERESDG